MSQHNVETVSCDMSDMWQNNEIMLTLKFDMDKYSLLENKSQQMLKTNRTNCYICKSCHLQLQPKCTCMCCNIDVQKDISKMYNKLDYDFTSLVVSQCLGHVSNSGNAEQYICASCDKRLKETSNENPDLPYNEKYPNAVAGANFLKAMNQRPEYVWTCCHPMWFHKTVWLFHTTDYDMSDEIVKECYHIDMWWNCTGTHLMKMMKWQQINGHNLWEMM